MASTQRQQTVPPVEEEFVREQGSRAVFPVHIDRFEAFLSASKAWIRVGERETLEESSELLQLIADLAIGVLQPWITSAGIVVSVASEESFKRDMRRKITGIAETLRTVMMRDLEVCSDMLKALETANRYALGVESAAREEMSRTSEAIKSASEKCINALRKTAVAVPAFMVAIDILLGAIQANLPAGMMSNVIKGRVGFITD